MILVARGYLLIVFTHTRYITATNAVGKNEYKPITIVPHQDKYKDKLYNIILIEKEITSGDNK